MQLTYLHIRNFKSIRDLEIRGIDRALILVGKNNTGKTSVLDAVCAVCGCYEVREEDFNENGRPSALTPDFALRRKTLSCSTAGGLSASTDVLMCGDVYLGSGFPPLRMGSCLLPSM